MDSFTGGVYSSDGEFIEDSLLYRGKQAQFQKSIEHLNGIYIYGGCLFGHFGHFILESLQRLYTIRQCKEYPILFLSPNDKVYDVQKIVFKSIGVRNEILLVKKPTDVENLLYSPPGSSIHPMFITDDQENSLKHFSFSANNGYSKKIWLSRTQLKYGKLDNESVIEEGLRQIGYEIICPETLPLREQVKLICTSTIVAGCDGSAFFSLLFAKDIYSKFFVFNRRRNIPSMIPYVFEKRNVQFEQWTFDLEPVHEEWPVSIFHHQNQHKIVDILKYAL
jgi:capsular polysaccharide biosynthesis protein